MSHGETVKLLCVSRGVCCFSGKFPLILVLMLCSDHSVIEFDDVSLGVVFLIRGYCVFWLAVG